MLSVVDSFCAFFMGAALGMGVVVVFAVALCRAAHRPMPEPPIKKGNQ